jgi:two-component system sensor histidine kinase CpxA
MRSFILSWFLAATLLLALAFSAGVILTGPQLVLAIWGYYGSGVVQISAQSAVAAYEAGGVTALRDYQRGISPDERTTIYLFDQQGKEVQGRAVSTPIRALVEKVKPNGEEQIRALGRGVIEGVAVRGREGGAYRVVVAAASRRAVGLTPNLIGWSLRIGLELLLAMALCSWLAWQLSAPVVRLRRAARAFAAGDLSARADAEAFPARPPEYRELAGDFDEMAARIQTLLTAQGQLMRDISHELRTPLTRLSLAVNLARGLEEERPKALNRIEEEAERLNRLIDRILRLARLESLDETARTEPIEMADFVEGIVADAQFEGQARNRTVALERAEICRMRGNREMLREAIENVVRNAIRYTPEGAAVTVEAGRVGGDQYRVVVRDAGPGVAVEHLDRIFETFYRAPGAGEAGFGLGLAIAKRAVALHGGTIRAVNRPEGGLEVEIRVAIRDM